MVRKLVLQNCSYVLIYQQKFCSFLWYFSKHSHVANFLDLIHKQWNLGNQDDIYNEFKFIGVRLEITHISI